MSVFPLKIDSDIAKRRALSPQLLSAGDTYGVEFDRLGASEYPFESVSLAVIVGADSGTPDSFTLDCVLQESDTSGSGYTDVASITQIDLEDEVETCSYNLNSLKRYIRPKFTAAFVNGSSPKLNVAALYMFGDSKSNPVDDSKSNPVE